MHSATGDVVPKIATWFRAQGPKSKREPPTFSGVPAPHSPTSRVVDLTIAAERFVLHAWFAVRRAARTRCLQLRWLWLGQSRGD